MTIKTFNLIHHVYPRRGNDVWRWHAEQLGRRAEIFNGRRVVAIASDVQSEPADVVERAYREALGDVEFLHVANDPVLRESTSLVPLFERVRSLDHGQATFRCHAKGVTHAGESLRAMRAWSDRMYRELLDESDVAAALETRVMLGVAFCGEQLRFSGSFWWFRNADLFAGQAWRELSNTPGLGPGWSIEELPQRLFAAEQCASIACDISPERWSDPVSWGLEPAPRSEVTTPPDAHRVYELAADRLSPPACGCQAGCEAVRSACRPGQVDVTLRCRACGAREHYVLDETGKVIQHGTNHEEHEGHEDGDQSPCK